MAAKKQVNSLTAIIIIVIVLVVAGVLFWNAAKGKPKRAPGPEGMQGVDTQGRGPGTGSMAGKGPSRGQRRGM
jgi:hypothetical protein